MKKIVFFFLVVFSFASCETPTTTSTPTSTSSEMVYQYTIANKFISNEVDTFIYSLDVAPQKANFYITNQFATANNQLPTLMAGEIVLEYGVKNFQVLSVDSI